MSEIINKCDLAYSMIQKYQDNDSALIDEKQNIYKLVDEVSALVEKCELEPQEVDNLTYYFEYDIACTLETQIGEVRYLKPGEKGLWYFMLLNLMLVVVLQDEEVIGKLSK